MSEVEPKEVWAAGDFYEPYVGRWSRLVAAEFLGWLGITAGADWLDIGCGTGALCAEILHRCTPRSITGLDTSRGFLDFARARVADGRARVEQGDAQALPFGYRTFDAVVSGLVLNFVPDQARAVGEIRRVCRPGGTAAVYVSDYAGEMQMMRHFWNAASALDEKAREQLDEGVRFPICKPGPLRALFEGAGFRDIETRAIDVPTVFKDFHDFWSPFLGGQAPAPGYCMSLSEGDRERLRRRVRDGLPTAADCTISLIARAFAVRGLA